MNITTNLKSLIKTFPLVSVMAVTLALSPSVSMAAKGEHGYHADKKTHHNKSHRKQQGKANHHSKSHGNRHGRGIGYGTEKFRARGHDFNRHNRGHRSHKAHSHGHRSGHRHEHRRHDYYVINEHRAHEHYHHIDPLRFVIGLHTDNMDIILRD